MVALHAALLQAETLSRLQRHYLQGLMLKLEEEGAAQMTLTEWRALISHRETLAQLHVEFYAGNLG